MPDSLASSTSVATPRPRSTATRKTTKTPKKNQQGQVLGPKGQQTRERLIKAVEQLLQTKPLRDLRQADICRTAKVSPPAFYVYFPDIESLVLEAVARNQVLPAELELLMQENWEEPEIFDKARRFVCLYLEFWSQHYHLLKMRNLASDEGDTRMINLRLSFQVPIMEQLAAKIAAGQARSGDRSLKPVAGASVVIASLERLAPTVRFAFENEVREDMTNDDLIDAEAWILTRMIGGAVKSRR